jgi:hypothetical protein
MNPEKQKCYLAYFNGQRGAERNPANYQRRDDGSHIYHNTETYYEWWYFDASFDNGYHMVTTFHYRNLFLKPMVPSVQMFIYCPDGTRIDRYDLFKPEEVSADPDCCHVVMGQNRARDMGDHYELDLRIKDAGARLTFRNAVPPWKPGQGFNYRDEEDNMTAGWVVPVPHAHVEGALFLKDQTIPVKGSGYHDHNWGNYPCYQTFRGWYWGRIHHEKYTVDYGWVLPRDEEAPVVSPLLIAREGEIILSTDMMAAELNDVEKDAQFDQDIAGRIILRSDALGVGLHLDIRTRRTIESTRLPRVADWDQYYYRFLADYDMTVEVDGQSDAFSGEMLHEYIRL